MKKLKLNLDEIKVESFETSSIQSKLGTVVGQISGDICPPSYVGYCDTEEDRCTAIATCGVSCYGTYNCTCRCTLDDSGCL